MLKKRKMSKYIIYLRRNLINDKCYIGQTSNFKRREYNWKCLKVPYNKHIDADRAEYGLENFTVEILAETDNRDEAFELEKRFIADYNSVWPGGYNISTGGYGKSGVEGYWKGKHHSEEAKAKRSKPVYQYTLDNVLVRVWLSINECSRNGYNQGNVWACCNGKKKTYKGHIWSYFPLN